MEKNCIEIIVTNGMIWVNGTHIKVLLTHANLLVLTRKYNSYHRKHKYQLVREQEKQTTDCFCMKV